jgi:predicted dehydrogenase
MIRVALVGYGYAGRTFHAPLIRATPGLELVAISSSRKEQIAAELPGIAVAASPHDAYAAALVDLVVVATPNDTHGPIACAALRAGKHVVVDKPFAITLDEARDLVTLAHTTDRVLASFHNRRWDGDFLALKDLVGRRALGEVMHFESHFDRYRPQVRARWREQPGTGTGLWYDLGPHLVDQSLHLFGLPDRVQAILAAQRPGAQADDWAHVLLDYGRRHAILHASLVVSARLPRFIVHGDSGSWVKYGLDPQEARLNAALGLSEGRTAEREHALQIDGATGVERETPIPSGDYVQFYAQLRDALDGAGPNPVPPAQALAVTAVIEAAIHSAGKRRAMTLPLNDAEVRDFKTA